MTASKTRTIHVGHSPDPDDAFMFHALANDKRQAKAELDRLATLGHRFAAQDEVATLLKSLGGR